MPGWQFRPAKQIQRLMAIDVMRRLAAFRPIADYRYVGFGGYEFVDFDLVRRQLGIRDMTSIESNSKIERFEFNRPFPDIAVRQGRSNEILPEIALDEPLIVWLDYCGPVAHDVLRDVLLIGERLLAGSMLVVTVNANADEDGKRLEHLEARVGSERIPLDISREEQLDGWETAAVQRRILASEVRAGLAATGDNRRFEQLLNVQYRDTQRMQTWGGVFVDPGTDDRFRIADFGALEQVETGDEALRIRVPVLTAREVLRLEDELGQGHPPPSLPWLQRHESESFEQLHRWYPPVPAPM